MLWAARGNSDSHLYPQSVAPALLPIHPQMLLFPLNAWQLLASSVLRALGIAEGAVLNLCVCGVLWVNTFADVVLWPPLLQEPLAALESPLLAAAALCSVPSVVPRVNLCVWGGTGSWGQRCWQQCNLLQMLSVMGTGCGTSRGLQSQFALHFCEGTPINVMFLAPGVTPWKTTLPGVSNGANNPAIRVIDYDQDTLQVLVGTPVCTTLQLQNNCNSPSSQNRISQSTEAEWLYGRGL